MDASAAWPLLLLAMTVHGHGWPIEDLYPKSCSGVINIRIAYLHRVWNCLGNRVGLKSLYIRLIYIEILYILVIMVEWNSLGNVPIP